MFDRRRKASEAREVQIRKLEGLVSEAMHDELNATINGEHVDAHMHEEARLSFEADLNRLRG